ncbi:uncharacterized protein LOC129602872 isoform X1 [Paramacrobiotus metropolitanus]|uniref:uncharacterized protein LOC129602872 isoform X1 n=1 Tax=Paramacrobiotus metropolitanus TaxID=2943436 RepID=UPI0024458E59|nr:uncharacterized protein LOC129602872 isoform X1 [Paramacrobiotus metropolitanus]
MGRKKSSCAQHFNLSRELSSKCEKATCKFCGWSSAKNTVRMKAHLAKGCRDCPEDVRTAFLEELEETEESETDSRVDYSEVDPNETFETSRTSDRPRRVAGSKSPKRKKKRTISSRTALADEHREIDQALADYLFSTNLPLSTIENPFFIAFCKKMRPSYSLPNRSRVVSQSFVGGATSAHSQHVMTAASTTASVPLQLATFHPGNEGMSFLSAPTVQAVPQPSSVLDQSQQIPGGVQVFRIIPTSSTSLLSL